jgi:uncharacterized integral membrane protein
MTEVIRLQLTYILALLFAVIVAMFAIVNAQPVTVDFLFDEFQVSLALVILLSAFAGAIILGFLGIFKQIKTGFKFREVQNKNKKLESQVEETEKKLAEAESRLKEFEDKLAQKENALKELEARLSEKEEQIKQLEEKKVPETECEDAETGAREKEDEK